ncbi:MAG: DUF3131 domain-containing protein [Rhodobacteraceae bacterium]|nr:DUF3131 domain-containing protein [Paracoccaceae bacterium]
MLISRRTLLKLLATVAVVPSAGRVLAQGADAKPVFLLVDGITPDLSPDHLGVVLTALQNAGIPAGFIVRGAPGGTPAAADSAPMLLRQHLLTYPDLGEVIAWAPDICAADPFFQIRLAQAARRQTGELMGLGADPDAGRLQPITLAGTDQEGDVALDAIRAAGFRNVVLFAPDDTTSVSDRCDATTSCLRGAVTYRPNAGGPPFAERMSRALAAGMVQIRLSLDDAAALSVDALKTEVAALLAPVRTAIDASRLFATLPRQNIDWFDQGTARLVGLLVLTPAAPDAAAQAALAAFRAALAAAGISYSLAAAEGAAGPSDCLLLPGQGPASPLAEVACAATEAATPELLARLSAAGISTLVTLSGGDADLDATGVLHLQPAVTLTSGDTAALESLDTARDLVIAIAPTAYADGAGRRAVVQALIALQAAAQTEMGPMPGFIAGIYPPDPVYRLMLATRRDSAVPPEPPAELTAAAKATLIEDARTAWGYFERTRERATGLCASAVFESAYSKSVQSVLTMWDYASLIEATLAAHELGLIDDAKFRARAASLIAGLPTSTIAGLQLPNSEIASDRRMATARDYNPFDVGRLLIALRDLDRHPLSLGRAAGTVKKWDLGRTIVDGQIQAVTSGLLGPAPASHYTHYAARGFGLWGFEVNSPYGVDPQGSETDMQMRLLYTVGRIGPIGTEPMLLEGVELGMSMPTAYLSDMLYHAEARAYAATGKLYCVSEGPLDRKPYFTYQGFLVNRAANPWQVTPIDPMPEADDPAFQDSIRLVSSKAAFLWSAMRPGQYSDLLMDRIRSRARIAKGGYASGVYAASGLPTTDYTDINTNGVILEAVAYMLRGRRPRSA